jgi:multiple sugar transport system substrate-binding protein
MTTIALRGMTWQHRRAIDPLIETYPIFQQLRPDICVEWESRPLHGFEFTPVEELARKYDLIILDHPFAGDIASKGYLQPVDGLVDPLLESAFVGPSLASYRYGGNLWALPVDAACQVGAVRPDLLARLDRPYPRTWDELLVLGVAARRIGCYLAIGLRGVHSLMTLFTLCANLGRPCGTDPIVPLLDRDTARQALAAMRSLLAYCPPRALDWNSIDLHDAMVARDDLVCCPAVYCYATYAEVDVRRPLRFFDLPGLAGPTPRGSTLGGAGIGLSAHSVHPEAAKTYLLFLMEPATQRAFAAHHGQPARIDAWEAPAIDARYGGCYSTTRATIDAAWIRPRYAGYLEFQAEGGTLVERHLRGELAESALLERLELLHRVCGSQTRR